MVRVPKTVYCSLGVVFSLVFGSSLLFSQQPAASRTKAMSGRNTYNESCAACHGLDAHGSDKAVNIAGGSEAQHFSDAQLSGIIANGLPGTGMPAFRNLTAKQIEGVVSYLRSLQGKGRDQALPGDAKRGREIFFGKGECASCHTVAGHGGFLGPDLTSYAATSSAKGIREEIVKAERTPPAGYRSAVLTTAQGDRLEGLIRNEDNFSVQLQTRDGIFRFFQKSDLRNFERLDHSLMPTDYAQRLTSGELDDLVSFLISVSPEGKAGTARKKEYYEDE